MKRYLWVAIATIAVSAHASDNPFELQSNFGQIDKDQETILNDLKKIAEAKELAEEKIEDTIDDIPEKPTVEEETQKVAQTAPKEDTSDAIDGVTENAVSDDAIAQSLSAVVEDKPVEDTSMQKQKAKEEEERALKEAEKESQRRLDAMRAAALKASREEAAKRAAKAKEDAKKKEAALVAAREAERKEVEAYEKQRAEKLAKQQEAKAQKMMAQKTAMMQKREEVTKTTSTAMPAQKMNDIDVEKEKQEAKEAADRAYEEAVKEMSMEE